MAAAAGAFTHDSPAARIKKAARWRVRSRAAWRRRKRGLCETRLSGESLIFILCQLLSAFRGDWPLCPLGSLRNCRHDQDAVPMSLGEFNAVGGKIGEPRFAVLLIGQVTESVLAGRERGAEPPPAVRLTLHGQSPALPCC